MNFRYKLALVFFALLVSVVPLTAHAAGIFDFSIYDIFTWIFNAIANILQMVGGWILTLAGNLVDEMYKLNRNLLGGGDVATILGNNKFVEVGWSVARDMANLGFVLVLIIIAFSIILRFKTFGSYQLLVRLIAAAILVNFSLAIVSPLLALSDITTNFFMRAYGGKISVVMAGAFNPQRLIQQGELGSFSYGPSSDTARLANSATNVTFTIIFTFVTALVLFAFAFMLLIRYVYLIVLLVISPLAWLVWLVPGMSGLFHQWWDRFINWTLFMPLVSFFIYISLRAADALNKSNVWGTGLLDNGSAIVVISGLMLGGLIAAQKMGITGASFAMGVAQKVRGRALGLAKGAAIGAAKLPFQGIRRFALTAGTNEKGESFAQRAVTGLTKIPGLGRAFRGTAQRIGDAKAGLSKTIEERQKRFESLTNEDVKRRAKTAVLEDQQATLAGVLAKRGLTSEIPEDVLNRLLAAARVTGTGKNITKSRPDLAPRLGLTIEKVMKGVSPKQAAEDIDKEAFKNREVILNLKDSHLTKLGEEGSPEKKDNLREAVDAAIADLNSLSKEQLQELNRIEKFIRENSHWQA